MAVDPRMQGAFDKTVQHGLQAVTDPKVSARVAQDAKARGPEAAIVEATKQAMQGVAQAAQQAGVQLPPEVIGAAAVAIAHVMVAMMVEAGMVDDPDAVLAAVMQQLEAAGQQAQQGQPQGAPPGQAPPQTAPQGPPGGGMLQMRGA